MNDDELEVEQRFATVPEWVLFSEGLKDGAVRLYAVIQRFGQESGARMPGRSLLAVKMHCSVDKIDVLKTNLEESGALRVVRSPAVRKGAAGIVRAPNRYFLRTTDPSVAHALPAQRPSRKTAATPSRETSATVAARMRHHPEGTTTTTPTAPTPRPAALEAVVVDRNGDDQALIDSLTDLVEELRAIREADGSSTQLWTYRGVRKAVEETLTEGQHPARFVAQALRVCARDPLSRGPARLPHAGPWWHQAELDLRDAHRHQLGRSLREAIDACSRCDEAGWLLPDVDRKCDHQAEAATA